MEGQKMIRMGKSGCPNGHLVSEQKRRKTEMEAEKNYLVIGYHKGSYQR